MVSIGLLPVAVRELGVRSLLQYGAYALGLRSGWIRSRTPAFGWEVRPFRRWLAGGVSEAQVLRSRERFFFDPRQDLAPALAKFMEAGECPALPEAEAILRGEFRPFGGNRVFLGFPPPWNRFLPGGEHRLDPPLPSDRHWTGYDLAGSSDLKLVWELSRFGWIYPLARAYRRTGDSRFWAGCRRLLESWLEANPPNRGPQWISGQEAAIRILALIFAWNAFAPALEKDLRAAERLLTAVAVHAARLPPTLIYARSQRNNHVLVEAVGLYSCGLLFPFFRAARRWKALGRRTLLAALADQVFPDGGYIQHSTNYHRMALQAGLWATGLSEIHAEPLPLEARRALERMADCLGAMVDPETGQAPNLGHNDGSEILPLSSSAYRDHRPTLQAAARLLRGQSAYSEGPWDEFALWLGLEGEAKPTGEVAEGEARDQFPHAGLYFIRSDRSWAMLRCARYRSRPAQSDQLNLDLWWQGYNLVMDPGSYRYAAASPWDNALAGAAAHNGLLVDGIEPMQRAGRFLWLDWAQGKFLGRWRSTKGDLELILASHDGYRRLGISHRRAVLRAGERLWLVVDDVLGEGVHRIRSAWTLPDWEWSLSGGELALKGPPGMVRVILEPAQAGRALARAGTKAAGDDPGEEIATLGWWSPTYAERRPALCLLNWIEGALPLRTLTWWCLGQAGPSELELTWRPAAAGLPPLAAAAWRGARLSL